MFSCKHCGTELDEHDVDNNIATWGVFRVVCSDDECMLYEDTINPYTESN